MGHGRLTIFCCLRPIPRFSWLKGWESYDDIFSYKVWIFFFPPPKAKPFWEIWILQALAVCKAWTQRYLFSSQQDFSVWGSPPQDKSCVSIKMASTQPPTPIRGRALGCIEFGSFIVQKSKWEISTVHKTSRKNDYSGLLFVGRGEISVAWGKDLAWEPQHGETWRTAKNMNFQITPHSFTGRCFSLAPVACLNGIVPRKASPQNSCVCRFDYQIAGGNPNPYFPFPVRVEDRPEQAESQINLSASEIHLLPFASGGCWRFILRTCINRQQSHDDSASTLALKETWARANESWGEKLGLHWVITVTSLCCSLIS